MKKKKIFVIVAIIIFVLMLIPIKDRLYDGGSTEYKAILYKYTKIHRISNISSTGYEDGWELKILGIHVGGKINTHVMSEHEIDLINYANEYIDFDFTNYVISAEGEYEVDHANITFELDNLKIEDFKTNIVNSIGIMPDGYHYDPIIDNAIIIKKYHKVKGGKILQTVSISGALYSKEDKYYFTIIG